LNTIKPLKFIPKYNIKINKERSTKDLLTDLSQPNIKINANPEEQTIKLPQSTPDLYLNQDFHTKTKSRSKTPDLTLSQNSYRKLFKKYPKSKGLEILSKHKSPKPNTPNIELTFFPDISQSVNNDSLKNGNNKKQVENRNQLLTPSTANSSRPCINQVEYKSSTFKSINYLVQESQGSRPKTPKQKHPGNYSGLSY